jgi:hypothetical protein
MIETNALRIGWRRIVCGMVTLLSACPADAQRASVDSATHAAIMTLADSVAGDGSTVVRTRRLVHWIGDQFTWSYTDYQRRTPVEIIARRAGNCAELSSVLATLLESLGIRYRWVREINVQPIPTLRRQATAAALVAQRGVSFSVFGLQHNDHVWLEIRDEASQAWFPADAAYGVVDRAEWTAARLALDRRPPPRVAAVVPIAAEMVVPFVVLAGERRARPDDDDRTRHYVVDGLKQLYGDVITTLPSWTVWTDAVAALGVHARAAFAGTQNLHLREGDIAKVHGAYEALRAEAAARGLRWRSDAVPSPR